MKSQNNIFFPVILCFFCMGASFLKPELNAFHSIVREKQENKDKNLLEGDLSTALSLGGVREESSYRIKGAITVSKNNNSNKIELWMGENAEIVFVLSQKLELSLGRRKFPSLGFDFGNRNDGVDGFTFIIPSHSHWQIELYLLDFYNGYRLYELDRFRSEKEYIGINRDVHHKNELYRTRHGLGVQNDWGFLKTEIHFLYLNLGNWGYYSKDRIDGSIQGDGDFITHSGFAVSYIHGHFGFVLNAELSRGIDKTGYNPSTQKDYIPFEGEMVRFSITWLGNFILSSFSLFMPNSDRYDKKGGQFIAYGYVGTGKSPLQSPLLSWRLHQNPSAWITGNGLEKEGPQSVFLQFMAGMYKKQFAFVLKVNYLLPYVGDKITGDIGLNRRAYAKTFQWESCLELQYNKKENFFILAYSRLMASKEALREGESVAFSGGIQF